MTQIVESLLADAARLLPLAAGVFVAFMVLRTWARTRSAGSVLVAVLVGALVMAFVTDTAGLSSLVWEEIESRAGGAGVPGGVVGGVGGGGVGG